MWRLAPLSLLVLACAPAPARVPGPAPAQEAAPGSSNLRPVALTDLRMQPLTRFLDSAVAAGAAPGAVLAISSAGVRFIYGTGQLGADEPARPGEATIYDLASLTKVVALVPAAMLAVDEGRLSLDAPVRQYVPEFSGEEKGRVTVRMLLEHAGGLPAWHPLFQEAHTRADVFALADTTPLEFAPGTRATYSDLGAIVLTQVLETVFHQRLDSLLAQRLFRPLGLESTGYMPGPELRDRIAPTELDSWRGRVLRGEVHDENAAAMEGVSGHAGLFSTAGDLLTYAEWLIQRWHDESTGPGAAALVRGSTVREFTRRQSLVSGSTRALGWDTPGEESSAGHRLSADSFGHTGFTGTSLWIDPDRRLAIVLLSNRVNPTRNNPRWSPVRGAIADLAITTLFEDAR